MDYLGWVKKTDGVRREEVFNDTVEFGFSISSPGLVKTVQVWAGPSSVAVYSLLLSSPVLAASLTIKWLRAFFFFFFSVSILGRS